MREIKFRSWASAYGEMLRNVQNYIGNGDWAFGNMLSKPDEFKIMQYTGLKDCNGVEVYEGDIVSHGGQVFSIVFDTNMGGWYLRNDGCGIQWHEQAVRRGCLPYKVIGNIHENPELLNAR